MKQCAKCFGEPQPLKNFGKLAQADDGLKTQCRKCVAIYNKKYKTGIKALGNEPWQERIGFLTI